MEVDRLIYPIKTLGPGRRIVLWTIGCPHKCDNCSNPELWSSNTHKTMEIKKLVKIIKDIVKSNEVDGLTITGGEPFIQNDLPAFLVEMKKIFPDILVYTGFLYEEIDSSNIDVLIDGKYMDDLNDNIVPLRGSKNQRIWYLNQSIKQKYEEYLQQKRSVQNLFYEGNLISVGIPNKLGE